MEEQTSIQNIINCFHSPKPRDEKQEEGTSLYDAVVIYIHNTFSPLCSKDVKKTIMNLLSIHLLSPFIFLCPHRICKLNLQSLQSTLAGPKQCLSYTPSQPNPKTTHLMMFNATVRIRLCTNQFLSTCTWPSVRASITLCRIYNYSRF